MRALNVYQVVFSLLNVIIIKGHVNEVEDSSGRGHSMELTQSMNLARQELVQEFCGRYPPQHTLDDLLPNQLDHILVNDEHKLLYCYVPKVACTNWKRILMILSNQWNSTDVLSIPASLAHSPGLFRNLSTVGQEERGVMLETYHRLILVRNPFERLLSAYRNKLEGDSQSARYFQERVGRRIIKTFRQKPTNESLSLGHDVTFKEFAIFLTNKSEELADLAHNEHWQPITDLCHPCLVKYNLIGKYETLLDDSLLALHSINASHIRFPRLARTSGTAEKLFRYFSQLDLPLIRRLYKLYKHDFKMFKYDLDSIVGFDLG